jgi:hypothetical protein
VGNLLSPGDYALAPIFYLPFPDPYPNFHVYRFTVPATGMPTVTTSIETNHFKVSVIGVPDVQYIVQVSSDLVSWNNAATFNGAPFTWTDPTAIGLEPRYYRVKIKGN